MNTNDHMQEYLSQLSAVEQALKYADGDQKSNLLDLKSKLEELIQLLQGSESNVSDDEKVPSEEQNDQSSMDEEFARFQKEIMGLDGSSDDKKEMKQTVDSEDSSSNDSITQSNQELSAVLSSLEGSKCRAPYSFEWGEKHYHNAMILSSDFEVSLEGDSDFKVSVLFCNPLCDKMKPCSFFLNGHCKFSDDFCRFSHGHKVNFSELQEFLLPDFSQLTIDAKCLVKGNDDLWQRATVEKCLPEQMYLIKYDRTGRTKTLNIHDIMPLENCHNDDSSDEETQLESFANENADLKFPASINSFVPPASYSSPGALWEQHTKSIGSKLMEKMGHVWGQGLGKNSDGRLEPIEAVILPAGKSLDKCIEMREACNPKGPIALETKLETEQDREKQRAKRVKAGVQIAKKNVFDFINSKISKVKSNETHMNISKEEPSSDSSIPNKTLNVQVFAVGEDIKKAKKELYRLHQSLARNRNENDLRSRVEKKIIAQNSLIKSLQAKEQRLCDSIKCQSNQKKLTIF